LPARCRPPLAGTAGIMARPALSGLAGGGGLRSRLGWHHLARERAAVPAQMTYAL